MALESVDLGFKCKITPYLNFLFKKKKSLPGMCSQLCCTLAMCQVWMKQYAAILLPLGSFAVACALQVDTLPN